MLYHHHVEHNDNSRVTKNFVAAKTLKTLLLSLAVSDLGVGLLCQLMYITYLVMKLVPNTEHSFTLLSLFNMVTNLLSYASFFGVTAL